MVHGKEIHGINNNHQGGKHPGHAPEHAGKYDYTGNQYHIGIGHL